MGEKGIDSSNLCEIKTGETRERHMPIKYIATAISAIGLLSAASAANAGNCAGPDCAINVQYTPSMAPKFGPMTVSNNHPMGHLRTVDFQRAPNVSIMRVHGMAPTANLSDAPTGFSKGCHPQSTQYCRQDGVVAPVPLKQPGYSQQVRIPTNYALQQRPVAPAPIRTGQGYDASKFVPRQYGENTFTPGIAHIPTSIVDRSPENADRALNSGRTVPQPLASGGVAPRPSMIAPTRQPVYSQQVRIPDTFRGPRSFSYGPVTPAPRPMPMAMPMGRMAGAPVLQSNGAYGSTVGADGTYWEKMSGPTMLGNTMATQVICKRQVKQRVINPVVRVPVPVPTPVPTTCGPQQQPHANHMTGPSSVWTY